MKQYMSDIIGEEYKSWKAGDKVLLDAPTGVGKTTFIIDVLFPYAIENNRQILYLCNRKALKDQINSKISEKIRAYMAVGKFDARKFIDVMTYQEIELYSKTSSETYLYERFNGAFYVICDEAHYFFSDSLFNPSTILSYRFIRRMYEDKAFIFISATSTRIKNCLGEVEYNLAFEGQAGNPMADTFRDTARKKIYGMKVYSIQKDYSYVNVKAFHFDDSVVPLIQDDKISSKWLIFMNDIDRGNKIVRDLVKGGVDAIFIDASYESDAEAKKAMNEITVSEYSAHKVLVTTSVLYNGVSLNDVELRNLVIFADTDEEFIQMLGRKRSDGKEVNVYISAQSAEIFKRRFNYLDRIQKTINWALPFAISNPGSLISRAFDDPSLYTKLRHFLAVITDSNGMQGWFYPNYFTLSEIANRMEYYKTLISRFESEGENAFIKTQMEWLGKSEDDLICIDDGSEKEIYRQKLIKKLDEWVGRDFSDEENKKEFLPSIREEVRKLLKLYNPEDRKKLDENVRKNDRVISLDTFNGLMGIFSLGYKMLGGGDSKVFKIIKN